MAVDRAKIERLEKELEETRRELLKEDGERYRVLMRDISKDEKERILEGLTDKGERILFGLEAPEEKKRGVDGSRQGTLAWYPDTCPCVYMSDKRRA